MLNAKVCATPCKLSSFELCAIIHENPPRDIESEDYALQELNCYLLCDVNHCHCLHPLGEGVNSYEEKLETSRSPGQRTHDVDSPDCEGPGEINGSERVGVFCSLLLEKLIFLSFGDYFHRIITNCGLIESMRECLVDDSAP
jgi:hypothetical protein